MKPILSATALARVAQCKALQRRRHRHTVRLPRSARSPQQRQGDKYEQQAALFLQNQGLQILDTKLCTPFGEIDLIARDQHMLVFVEVRYRRHSHFGGAVASVNRSKQQRIRLSASLLLPALCVQHFQSVLPACRFDVVAFSDTECIWIQHAFL